MNPFCELFSEIVASEGAIVEKFGEDTLEVCLPEALQGGLDLPELSRLGFGSRQSEATKRVSFNGEWSERLCKILGPAGEVFEWKGFETELGKISEAKLCSIIERKFVLSNATYRFHGREQQLGSFVLFSFHATLSSDDKREFLIDVCLNEINGLPASPLGSTMREMIKRSEFAHTGPDIQSELPARKEAKALCARAFSIAERKLELLAEPFFKGMRRRLARDSEVLFTYHSQMLAEVTRRAGLKLNRDPNSDLSREQERYSATTREYWAKCRDLERKYSVHIHPQLIQVARFVVPVWRLKLDLHRRKEKRRIETDWNPLSRSIEDLCCECCGSLTEDGHLICDDQLHIICAQCFRPCSRSTKEHCALCCPNCKGSP